MTLEELERRAYADGDVEKAALLRLAIDGEEEFAALARHEGYEQGYDDGVRAAAEASE